MLRKKGVIGWKKLWVLEKYVLTETQRVCMRLIAKDERGEHKSTNKGEFIGMRIVWNLTHKQSQLDRDNICY